jgi:hypothetical protein
MKQSVCLAILVVAISACTTELGVDSSSQVPSPDTVCAAVQLATDLPASPTSVQVYWQLPIDTSLDAMRALAVAGRLGVTGSTSSYVGESGIESFIVADSDTEVTVFSDLPLNFTYSSDSRPLSGMPPTILYSPQERADLSEAFLQEHDLLNFDYRIENTIGSMSDYSVRIVPLFAGVPLFENDPFNPRIWVTLDAEGQVWHLFYETLELEVVGEAPVRQADEVWSQLCHEEKPEGLLYTAYNTTEPGITTRGHIPVPGDQPLPTDLSNVSGQIDLVELVYYPFDLRFASATAYPPDSPVRFIQPAWRFVGRLGNGEQFEILAPALTNEALQSLVPPS